MLLVEDNVRLGDEWLRRVDDLRKVIVASNEYRMRSHFSQAPVGSGRTVKPGAN
jgi:hypothetical protein